MTIAGGGSFLGGHVSSLDENMTVPGNGDTPMAVSTGTRINHRFEVTAVSQPVLSLPDADNGLEE